MSRHTLRRRRPLWERIATTASITTSIALPIGVPWLMLHPAATRTIDCANAVPGAAECR